LNEVSLVDDISGILNKAVTALSAVPGVRAVVLGGSRARGTHSPASDIDIGIYYDSPALDIDALSNAARSVDDEHRENLIAPPGGWGNWVNGGGWLVTDGCPVDFVLRDISRAAAIVAECREGLVTPHYQTGHPHAFISAMYMGELAVCRLLWEKDSAVSDMKRLAEQYPDKLQEALIHLFSFEAEFSLWLAENSVDKDDIYYVTAHFVRSVSALNQVLFALNKEYCLNEKKAVKMIDTFQIRPIDYKGRVDDIFAAAGTAPTNACAQLRDLADAVKALLTAEQTAHVAATLDGLSDSKGKHYDG
jgi:predicted nucleotidyltransferase